MKAIVDIDNTLWDFASVLYLSLKNLNPLVPEPEYWTRWDFFKDYVSVEEFYKTIEEIHLRQDEFGTYDGAQEFLRGLKKMGFTIIIASHRVKESERATVNWLEKNSLIYDDLHISYDKTVLFSDDAIVIDDSPFVLEKAKIRGLTCTGLIFPWNRGRGFLLFKNLKEITSFIEKTFECFKDRIPIPLIHGNNPSFARKLDPLY